MSEKDRILDENLRRLLQASLGEETQPPPQTRENVYQALKVEAQRRYGQQDFPSFCLALLGGFVLLGSVWLFVDGAHLPALPNLQAITFLLALIPLSNLLLLPVAAYLIIKQRGQNAKKIS